MIQATFIGKENGKALASQWHPREITVPPRCWKRKGVRPLKHLNGMGRGENSVQPVSEIMLLLVLREFPRAVMPGDHDTLLRQSKARARAKTKTVWIEEVCLLFFSSQR